KIRSQVGTIAGDRWIVGQLDNQGTVTVENSLSIDNNGRTLTGTAGTFDVSAGSGLSVFRGNTIVGPGTVLTGSGLIDFYDSNTITLAGDITLPAAGTTLVFDGADTIQGTGTLTNLGNLVLASDTVNVPLVNQGTVRVQADSALNAALTTTAGSAIQVQADGF